MRERNPRKHATRCALLACFLVTDSAGAYAAAQETAQDESTMRHEIEELKAQVRELRERLDALMSAQGAARIPPPSPEPETEPPPVQLPPPGPRGGGANVFNPAISAVFQTIGDSSINHNRDDDGFSLSEAEIGLQAVVDPYARVDLFLAFSAEGEAEIEEAYGTLLAIPGGLQAKGGRFKSAFGKWNQLHNHAFFTVERPEVLTSFFGEESLTADGGSLSWLVPGTGTVYLESVTEVGSTGNDVTFNGRRRDLLLLEHVSSVFTLSPNATLEFGLSAAAGKAEASEQLLEEIDDAGLSAALTPSGSLASNVFGADFTYKWKPLQFNVYRSFLWQSELLASRRRAQSLDPGGFLTRDTISSSGGYSYAEYQFAKRWRAGLRYDLSQLPDNDSARVRGASAVLRMQPTEFQEFRIQFKHTGRNRLAAAAFDDIGSDNELLIEWIPVIGAHAAHKY